MKKIGFIFISFIFITSIALADTDYDAYRERMARNNAVIEEEINFAREKKLQEIKAETYARELELQRSDISVNNSTSFNSETNSTSNAMASSAASNRNIEDK